MKYFASIRKNGPSRPCPFCDKFQTRLTRHLRLRHAKEPQVSKALLLPKSARDAAFAAVKKSAIYGHNLEQMKQPGKSELVRERNQGVGKELLICGICHGCYIWSHKKRCRSTSAINFPLPVSLVETSAVSEEFKCTILRLFRNDAVGRICQNDHAILLVGEKLFAKLKKKPDKKTEVKRSIMADMRKLGNLYLEFTQQNPPSLGSPASSVDMLERRNFPTLEKAITIYTTRDDTDLKAGLKASLYYLLKTMARIVKGTYIVNHEDDKATEIDKFVVVLELNHASVFGDATYRINLSRQTKLRRPQNLPVDEDIAKVRDYTVRTLKSLTSSHDELSCSNFLLLRDLAVCRLTLFNFRRGGEPARLRIADWVDAQNDVWLDKTRIKKMHPVEQELFSSLKVIYQTGKGNDHLVPVLVPVDVAAALCLLSRPSHRKAVGVRDDNVYLFPVVHADEGHCSGWHSVHRIAVRSGVQDCASITATKMRHYSSTHYAGLDVPENQRAYFYMHMGHSKRINETIYQTPLAEAEVSIVGKVLQQIDRGTMKPRYDVTLSN